jgi:hypothetical protein
VEPIFTSAHLDIQSCWPNSEADVVRYTQQVTPRGREAHAAQVPESTTSTATAPEPVRDWVLKSLGQIFRPNENKEDVLGPNGVLQVCLLAMEPFQGCRIEEIRDGRIPITDLSQRTFPCQNRPLLIEALAEALLNYEESLCHLTEDQRTLPGYFKEGLDRVTVGVKFYADLCARRVLHDKPVTPASVMRNLNNVTKALEALPPAVYQQEAERIKQAYKEQLLLAMCDAFQRYGPPAPHYRKAVVHYSLAVILRRLGIEQAPNHEQIASRISKRLARVERAHRPS